ncbi:unnamed protein product [Diatraea saccharalis]|uniref:Uncharacterized protein n=1 Tax=Diatraea saccharalis TaxID=40085 RepID=A0A9N9N330_9NEOP|nr:unnamed protein product [Diatraea saccharalis]
MGDGNHLPSAGITVIAKGIAKPLEKEGVEYLQAEKVITRVKIGHGQVAIDDTERPVAAVSAATFFNASPGVVLDILNPLIEETSAAVIKAFINKVLGAIPLKEVLTDKNDPNVADCIRRMAEQAKNVLAAGVPSLGVQSLEPLRVPSIRLRQHNMPRNKFKYDAWLSDLTRIPRRPESDRQHKPTSVGSNRRIRGLGAIPDAASGIHWETFSQFQ